MCRSGGPSGSGVEGAAAAGDTDRVDVEVPGAAPSQGDRSRVGSESHMMCESQQVVTIDRCGRLRRLDGVADRVSCNLTFRQEVPYV